MTSTKNVPNPGDDEVGRSEIALTLGVSEREITNLVKAHPEFPSVITGRSRTFPRRRCVQWYVRFKAQEAVKRAKPATPSNVDEMRRRQVEAEMRMAEMDVAEREARLVSVDHVDQVVSEVCERLRAILVNVPGNYGLRLEELGIDAAAAESVLTAIVDDLTGPLRAAVDDMEHPSAEEPSGDDTAADASDTAAD